MRVCEYVDRKLESWAKPGGFICILPAASSVVDPLQPRFQHIHCIAVFILSLPLFSSNLSTHRLTELANELVTSSRPVSAFLSQAKQVSHCFHCFHCRSSDRPFTTTNPPTATHRPRPHIRHKLVVDN